MRTSAAALAALAILMTGSIPAARQQARPSDLRQTTGTIRGAVVDASGGLLPGVTVAAAGPDGQLLATVATDGSGAYVITGVPAGSVTLAFQLEGFDEATELVVVRAGQESRVASRLRLAALLETVIVRAPAATDTPRSRFVAPPPPPLVARPLPEHDRAAVCGPAKPDRFQESLGTIRSRRHETQGELYLSGAELVIDGGREQGLLVGRNLVVRRYYHVRGALGEDVLAEHSAGVVQIVAATERSSVALVVYACDEMRKGDFLASFNPGPVRDPEPAGAPAYDDAARILFADDGQTLGAPERMMVIDRGAAQGIRIGQRFTLFRQPADATLRRPGGEAIVVSVRNDSSTIRIEQVTDALAAGDWAAPQLSVRSAGDRH
jgi:hypothetical protein